MPLLRREDSQDPLAPYILLVWQKKWLIVGIAFLTAALTYGALLFVKSSFRANAEIFVNRLPSVPEGETPNPDTVKSLLKSPSVIEKVRNEYVRKFGIEPPKIERFIKAFSVESTVLQDTSVRKEMSPVLQLEVEAEGAEATQFVMASWVKNFIEAFGNYMVQEALVKRDAYIKEKERIEKEMLELTRQQIDVQSRLPYIRKTFAEKLDQLSPARLRNSIDELNDNAVQFIIQAPRMEPGLLERYSELKLRMDNGTASTTSSAELRALAAAIDDVKTSVTDIEKQYADAKFEDDRLTREINLLTETRKSVNDAITRFTVASAVYRNDAEGGLPSGGDIRALSMPVRPEARVWPKRSIAAVVAAIVGGILAIFFVILRQYLSNLTRRAS